MKNQGLVGRLLIALQTQEIAYLEHCAHSKMLLSNFTFG